MDDDFALLAVPVPDPVPPPRDGEQFDAGGAATLPFPPPAAPGRADTILLRGYDAPGEFFQPRLRTNDAA